MSNCIGDFTELIGCEADSKIMIVGAAATVKHYQEEIKSLIKEQNIVTIGINKMTHVLVPDYHVWTNNQRLRDFGDCINESSTVIFGNSLKEENKNKWNTDYYNLNYIDMVFADEYIIPSIKNGKIKGSFRCAGHLSLYLAKLLGAETIYYVGVDGYSKPFKGDQHCYGKGFTDTDDMEYAKKKDEIFRLCMVEIKKVVDFSIITPTLFEDFYNANVMATDTK